MLVNSEKYFAVVTHTLDADHPVTIDISELFESLEGVRTAVRNLLPESSVKGSLHIEIRRMNDKRRIRRPSKGLARSDSPLPEVVSEKLPLLLNADPIFETNSREIFELWITDVLAGARPEIATPQEPLIPVSDEVPPGIMAIIKTQGAKIMWSEMRRDRINLKDNREYLAALLVTEVHGFKLLSIAEKAALLALASEEIEALPIFQEIRAWDSDIVDTLNELETVQIRITILEAFLAGKKGPRHRGLRALLEKMGIDVSQGQVPLETLKQEEYELEELLHWKQSRPWAIRIVELALFCEERIRKVDARMWIRQNEKKVWD